MSIADNLYVHRMAETLLADLVAAENSHTLPSSLPMSTMSRAQ